MSGGDDGASQLLKLPIKAIKFAQLDADAHNDDIADQPLSPYTTMGLMRMAAAKKLMIVGRRMETYDFLAGLTVDNASAKVDQYLAGEWCASDSFETLAATFPEVTHWESPNEPGVTTADGMIAYAKFLTLFAERLHARTGKIAVLGNWAIGTPDVSLWKHYGPVLEAVKQGIAVLGRHSYGPITGELGPWMGLRHRLDEVEFVKLGYAKSPLIIGEYGADSIFHDNVEIFKPWRLMFDADFSRYWNEYLRPFTNEFEADDYVLACFPFTCGNGQSANWDNHNYAHDDPAKVIEANPPIYITKVEPPPVVVTPPPVVTVPTLSSWPEWATHVTTGNVNVRTGPYTSELIPPLLGSFVAGKYVHSYGSIPNQKGVQQHLITQEGAMWVSGAYLQARP